MVRDRGRFVRLRDLAYTVRVGVALDADRKLRFVCAARSIGRRAAGTGLEPPSIEETVLKKPDEYAALILYGGALRAFEEKRLAELGTLFVGPPGAGAMRAFEEKHLEDAVCR